MSTIQIIKCNHLGKEVFRYKGKVLERSEKHILLEASFGLDNVTIVDVPMRLGDKFLETYYSDRWFNIYEIHSVEDDQLKAWYCNVSYPAEISANAVTFRDLALDLLVYPDGRQLVLDEDEFAALKLSTEDKQQALNGLEELKQRFGEQFLPK